MNLARVLSGQRKHEEALSLLSTLDTSSFADMCAYALVCFRAGKFLAGYEVCMRVRIYMCVCVHQVCVYVNMFVCDVC